MKCFHQGESKEEVSNLWFAIEEIAKLRPEYTCYLVAVQVESLQNMLENPEDDSNRSSMFTIEEIFEKVVRQIGTVRQMIDEKTLDVRNKGFEVIDSVWSFLNECSAEVVMKYKELLKQIVDAICGSAALMYQLALTESLVVQIFQKCFTPERKLIVLYLMEQFFDRIQFSEDDDNLDAELRKRVFHCLRRYTESIKNCFNKNDPEEALFAQKIFSFIIRLYITLIEEGNILDFEAFFEAKSTTSHDEMIFNTQVRYPHFVPTKILFPFLREAMMLK